MVSGGSSACRSRGRRDAMPKSCESDFPARWIHQDICRLEVLVDEATPVELCEGRNDRNGQSQEATQLHRRAEQPVERLAPGSSSISIVRPRSRINASGRTAQAPSNSSFNAYSWASRSRATGAGCSAASFTIRTSVRLPSAFRRRARQKTRSPSSHKTSRLSSSPRIREDTFICGTPEAGRHLAEKGRKVFVCLDWPVYS